MLFFLLSKPFSRTSLSSYEACVSPESPDFNPCVSHYAAIKTSDQSDDVTDDGSKRCLQEESYTFPAGTVCDHDHEDYKLS